ncbi:hypothetical protein M422DRAFT_193437 [Sphaerobolus stellatus SS14]|uniref:Uncharacterized protein n=1 Tax=Sphaerobolus stellatus (strain SS14) TaxID=990650 RepID=A0A0C9U8W4_SPHS4|nr:hypothetical protein M422DRAFT_193437 [Sphaerobolus stellatus SS14]
MSGVPQHQYDPRRLFVFACPTLPFSKYKRSIGVYIAGGLFALAHWMFWDAAIVSAHAQPPPDAPYDTVPVHVTFLDWVTGICSTLGLLVVNLINKEHLLSGDGYGQDQAIVWRARLFLFIGFALMAGGLAGSVTILVLKYILQEFEDKYVYYGYANVVQNVALMLSAIVLWLAQHASTEYEYNLTL